jgi:hypothetical protein
MAYDRYDTRDAPRGDRPRWRDDRGFFDRAGDEIASWFGDEEAERRRREDQRMMERERGYSSDWRRDEDRGRFSGRGDFDRDRDFERRRFSSSREPDFDRERERGYSPRNQFFAASGFARGGFGPDDFERERGWREREPYGRDEYRRTSYSGSERSGSFDPSYRSWRQRQLDDLDRDYDEYRRENQARFEDEFSTWRKRRQEKRGLLGQIREHMEVLGSDGEHVGTIDRTAGDRIVLTKSDPESGGVHHSLSCSDIDRVEENRIILDCTAEQAKQRWRDESRSRALFEREDQGEMGPRMLDRSFEGTYR